MWISRDGLRKKEKAAHIRGLELGYSLGLQDRRLAALDSARCYSDNRKSLVDQQIDAILSRKNEE